MFRTPNFSTMDHTTFLALLSKENLVQIASMLLTENIALKSRLEQMEPRVEQKVIEPIEELNTNLDDWLRQSNQSVSQSQTATSLEEVNQPALIPQGVEADNNNVALRKLFVRNISFQATPQDLAVAFSLICHMQIKATLIVIVLGFQSTGM